MINNIFYINNNSLYTHFIYVYDFTKRIIEYDSSILNMTSNNSDRFNEFIKNICDNVKNKLIILDNGQIHKKETTKK